MPSLLEYRKIKIIELLEAYNNMNSDKNKTIRRILRIIIYYSISM